VTSTQSRPRPRPRPLVRQSRRARHTTARWGSDATLVAAVA